MTVPLNKVLRASRYRIFAKCKCRGVTHLRAAFVTAAVLLTALTSAAQTPELINYQAVARDTESGAELAHREIYIICKILADGPEGAIVYQEAHENVRTNRFGLFNIRIGGGSPLSGNFHALSWSEGSRYLEIDIDAGEGLETLSPVQLVSVPYALHAKTADMVDDADADPTNELVESMIFNGADALLTLTEAGNTFEVNLTELIDDADADPTNEIIDNINFNPETRVLTVLEAGNTHTVVIPGGDGGEAAAIQNFSFDPATGELILLENDTPWSADMSWLTTDLDPENELITSVSFDENERILRIQEGGTAHNIDLSAIAPEAGQDNDPTNELITSVAFDEDSSVLSVTDPGQTFSVNLSALINDADADPENELITGISFDTSSSVLRIEEGENTFHIDLSALAEDADSDPTNELQTLSEVINYSEMQGETSVDLGNMTVVNIGTPTESHHAATKGYVDSYPLGGDLSGNLSLPQVSHIRGREIAETPPQDGDVLRYDAAEDKWMPATASAVGAQTEFVSVDPAAFTTLYIPGSDAKALVPEGNPAFLTAVGTTGECGAAAPLNLPHLAELEGLTVVFMRPSGAATAAISLERKQLTSSDYERIAQFTGSDLSSIGSLTAADIDLSTANENLRTVDNSMYTYRLHIIFNSPLGPAPGLPQNFEVHGAKIKYTR